MTISFVQAAGWGLVGGVVAGLVGLILQVSAANYRWPWKREEFGPRLFVLCAGLVIGGVVAGVTHAQMTGMAPAFAVGLSWPAVLRRFVSGIEVDIRPAGESLSGIVPPGMESPGQRAEEPEHTSGGEQ
jgi:hypothetical protein